MECVPTSGGNALTCIEAKCQTVNINVGHLQTKQKGWRDVAHFGQIQYNTRNLVKNS